MTVHEVIDVEQMDIYKRYNLLITTAQRTGKMDGGDLGAKYVEGVNDAFGLIYGELFTTLTTDIEGSE